MVDDQAWRALCLHLAGCHTGSACTRQHVCGGTGQQVMFRACFAGMLLVCGSARCVWIYCRMLRHTETLSYVTYPSLPHWLWGQPPARPPSRWWPPASLQSSLARAPGLATCSWPRHAVKILQNQANPTNWCLEPMTYEGSTRSTRPGQGRSAPKQDAVHFAILTRQTISFVTHCPLLCTPPSISSCCPPSRTSTLSPDGVT